MAAIPALAENISSLIQTFGLRTIALEARKPQAFGLLGPTEISKVWDLIPPSM